MIAVGDVLGAARILVIDDEPANVRMLDRLLTTSGCRHVTTLTDPREVIGQMPIARPDLIILDLHMPHLDGFEVMQALRPLLSVERYLPMLIITADDAPPVKQRALAMGARDFLAKPFDSVEALLRIRNLLVTRQLYAQLEREQQRLELAVEERTRALASTHIEIVYRLARAAEYRDDNTGEHTRRVGRLSGALARTLGLSDGDAAMIERAAPLHDVGKVGVPDAILLKPAQLSRRRARHHPHPSGDGRAHPVRQPRAAAADGRGDRARPPRAMGRHAAIRTAARARASRSPAASSPWPMPSTR